MPTSSILPQEIPSGYNLCGGCGCVKPRTSFRESWSSLRGRFYLRSLCIECERKNGREFERRTGRSAEKSKRWREENPDKYRDSIKHRDKSKSNEAARRWRAKHPEAHAEDVRNWRAKNKDKLNKIALERQARLWRESPMFRLQHKVKCSINRSLNGRKNGRHWEDLVGYALDNLRRHLESLFLPGMTWDNYGRGGWHIDHIRPISSFSFSSYDDPEFKECWALSNLQPLWETDNLRKSNKWTG